jgi:hypothetical protein
MLYDSRHLIVLFQISYNYMLPFEDIPDDLVPLTAYFKHLLTIATREQPMIVFLDSVDQLTGTQDTSKVSWLPTRLPPNCKVRKLASSLESLSILRTYIISFLL